jgi:hypothetical protein
MFSKFISAVVLTVLAGRVLAADTVNTFNVTIGPDGKHSTVVLAPDVLNFTIASYAVIASCDTQCATARAAITACKANDTACYCNEDPATGPPGLLQTCEACMFENLVRANKPAPVPLAGSNQVLTGWNAACSANATFTLKTPLGLSVANFDFWDGPFVAVFPTAVGWVLAVTGGVLGSSLIYMLCNM